MPPRIRPYQGGLSKSGIMIPPQTSFAPSASYDSLVTGHPNVTRYLKLDDASGATAVATVGANGTYTSIASYQAAGPGATQKAIALNGTSSMVQLSIGSIGTTWGMEIWAYIDSDSAAYDAFLNDNNTNPSFAYLLREQTTDELHRWNSFDTNYVLTRTNWHQLVLGANGASGQVIWVDGGGAGKKFTNANNGALGTSTMTLGSAISDHFLKGRLCRYSLYSTLPSDADVAARYAAGIV